MRFPTIIILACVGCSQRPAAFIPVADLKALPHVHAVDVVTAGKPAVQIIHVLDWHFVDRASFEADGGKDWEAFLESVEAVQGQQVDLLRRLRDSHGIDAVFLEGMTDADVEGFHTLTATFAEWEENVWDDDLNQLKDDDLIQFLREQHRQDVLLLGAAARVAGLTVLPAEDADAVKAANPLKVGFDSPAIEHREDAIVERLLASGKPVVVVGGDHDLTDNLARLGGRAEYVRVTVQAQRAAAGE